ncbi:thymidylate kinase [Clostridium sporogenes]|uniref:Thymidylate kinase n=1 Tax=Clostridium sporogenes TaxID=1509 RepID=A0A7X5PC59_CLOSG|nr:MULTISPECIES: thymidylate kinase [Clostridium]AJD32938.1 thymidylate kinase family protein [Clostridium botulinum Prevot_594]AVP60762.1 thymidylate kinase [Clostridium botulinum]AKC60819.1 thymidylate kinase [Clostridium sporogenes]AKJ88179.1 thymidylate kinase [Clostridium sporogenes]EHN15534.1 thymidylate kinase [Clostridium sporogenes PA 3679]
MERGRLIVIEGSDGSGKATQTKKLYDKLVKQNKKVKKVEFPNYKSESSALIKMYLSGEFGKNPDSVNPYASSTFYAIDRFASYKKDWEEFYLKGGIIIADRYTTSNMIHQAAKIKEVQAKDKFLNWLWDFEFEKFNLPVPDCVIFLDMPPKCSKSLMETRNNKFTGEKEKDIHENNYEYLLESYNNSKYISEKYGWNRIECTNEDKIKSIDQINDDIIKVITKYIDFSEQS